MRLGICVAALAAAGLAACGRPAAERASLTLDDPIQYWSEASGEAQFELALVGVQEWAQANGVTLGASETAAVVQDVSACLTREDDTATPTSTLRVNLYACAFKVSGVSPFD